MANYYFVDTKVESKLDERHVKRSDARSGPQAVVLSRPEAKEAAGTPGSRATIRQDLISQ